MISKLRWLLITLHIIWIMDKFLSAGYLVLCFVFFPICVWDSLFYFCDVTFGCSYFLLMFVGFKC